MVRIPDVADQEHPNVSHPFSGMNNRAADKISGFFGSMKMLYVLMCWQLAWMVLAIVHIPPFGKDPYPFIFLLFLGNLVQLWALPVLGATQNRADEKRNAKAQADHEAMTYLAQKIDEIYVILNGQAAEDSPKPDTPAR